MRWGLHKEALGGEGSRSRKLQADLPPGGSRRRRLLEKKAAGRRCFKRGRKLLEKYISRRRFCEKEAQIEGGWGSIRMRGLD